LTLTGDLAVNGDEITSDGNLTVTPAGGTFSVSSSIDHTAVDFWVNGGANVLVTNTDVDGAAVLKLAPGATSDTARIVYGNGGGADALIFSSRDATDTASKSITFDKDGNVTLDGDLAVNGDAITSDGDLTITPAGGEATIVGNLAVHGPNVDLNDDNTAAATFIKFHNDQYTGATSSLVLARERDAGGNGETYIAHNGTAEFRVGTLEAGDFRLFTNSTYALTIDGTTQDIVIAEDLYVTGVLTASANNCCGADYVFKDDYKLPELDELSTFVDANNHLPGMTINKPGPVDLGKGIQELLVKVEEQSLYILQLHDRITQLEAKLN